MLQIRLLGQFDLRLDGKRILVASRAGQSLLAYLALTAGTPHRREVLAGIFWPDFSDENARKNLRHELWRIRKALAGPPQVTGYLLADEFTIAFNRSADYWLDAAQLERPDLDIQSLTSNLSLYQGELLPGFYEDWIVLERERLQTVFETKMEQLLNQLIAAERWIAVQEQGERWLSFGNSPEPAYRALMLAHGARGDMARVSSVYQRCVADLDEKLGLVPSAETRALYDGLLKGTQTPVRSGLIQQAGTITFLFTDIEESTNLLEKLGDQYADILADHHQIMRAAIQKWNGNEVNTMGDAFFITFTRALDAVQCAAEAQRNLAAHTWQGGGTLRVRMGLHTGEPLIGSTGYVGMDVHRAARIGDTAHGGQVLLSHTTRELVINDTPKGLSIRDLGEYRLKDLKFPTPIYQLVIAGLASDFPPIRTKFTGTEAPTPGEPPFKGLQYFDETDSELFFGREVLTARLIGRLSASQFLSVIIGASGSGKSSVVRAGVVPALKKGAALIDGSQPPEDSASWRIHVLTPTAHPLAALATQLARDSESETATLLEEFMQDPRSLVLFLARQKPRRHTLLVLDQFEELFTLCRDEFEREAFIDNLLTALAPTPARAEQSARDDTQENGVGGNGKFSLIITLRADFYAHLAQYPELRDAVAHQQEYIGPMTIEELRRAIEEPARRGKWAFEPGLVDLILRDVGDEPGALPLLSHALLETWKRRAGHTLTLKGYADAGGVRGAIAHTAEGVYQELSENERMIARNIFLRLTELGEGTEDTRRRASFTELMTSTEEARPVLNKLAEARLVTLSEDQAEVAHEALIREWPQLREWLSQDREGIMLHRHLTEGAQEWELLEHDPGTLYRGARLSQAREWAALNPNALNANEKTFLDASDAMERQEQIERAAQQQRELEAAQKLAETERLRAQEQTRSATRLRMRNRLITTVGIIAVILALLAGVFGFQSNRNAQNAINAEATAVSNADAAQKAEGEAIRQQRLTLSRELAGNALVNLDMDPERSILLALQAVKQTYAVDGTITKEAVEALHRSLLNSRLRLTLYPQSGDGYGLALSPDGNQIVTSGGSGEIEFWDLASRTETFTLTGHEGVIYGVSFSPDGSRLVSASGDGTARIWDLDTKKMVFEFRGHTDEILSVDFSEDGKRIVTASIDGTARVWDAVNGQHLLTFAGHEAGVLWAEFNPTGTLVASTGEENTVRVWDSFSGQELYMLDDFLNYANSAAFSPDGKLLATNGDEVPKLWDAETGQLLFLLPGFNSVSIQAPVFTPDGKYVAVAGEDGSVSIWETATGLQYLTFFTGSPIDSQIEFSHECVEPPGASYNWCGVYLVTGHRDRTVRFWDVSPAGNREVMKIPGSSTCLSSDGLTLFSAAPEGDGIVQFHTWQLPTVSSAVEPSDPMSSAIQELSSYSVEFSGIQAHLAFSPDCSRSAIVDLDNFVVKVSDTRTGKQLLQFKLAEGTPSDFAYTASSFSPDSTRFATPGPENSAVVYDLKHGGRELLTLQGHTDGLMTVNFSPDGKQLATTSLDMTARLWDAETGQEIRTFSGHNDPTTNLVINPQATRLAVGSFDGTAKVWDLQTGEELYTLSGHGSSVWGIRFSSDGKLIATSSYETLRLWDAITGDELLALPVSGPSSQLFFPPDQTRLVVQTPFGIHVYLVQVEDLLALAKSRVSRTLTTEECQRYLHVEACPLTEP